MTRCFSSSALVALCLLGCAPGRVDGEGGDPLPGPGPGPMPMPMMKVTDPDLIDSGAPDDAKDQFGGAAGGAMPQLVYPLHGAMLARNINQMRLAFRAGAGQKLFRLVIDSAIYKRTYYLGAQGCSQDRCSYSVSDEDWGRVWWVLLLRPVPLIALASFVIFSLRRERKAASSQSPA